jgi:hypothetical protein
VAAAEAERQSRENEKQKQKDAKAALMARHPMKSARYAISAHGGPILGLTGGFSKAGSITIQFEYGMGPVCLDMGVGIYPGVNYGNMKDWENQSADGFYAVIIGGNYTIFGYKWLVNLGPGIAFTFGIKERIYIPYFNVRYDFRLTDYTGIGVYLRLGYRFDINDVKMANNGAYPGLDNKSGWFFTHCIFAGFSLTMP